VKRGSHVIRLADRRRQLLTGRRRRRVIETLALKRQPSSTRFPVSSSAVSVRCANCRELFDD